MLIKPIIFGKYKLKIDPKEKFTGNALFSKNHCGVEDFENVCKLISDELNRSFKDQNGKGWRYWRLEEDSEVQKLELLSKRFNSGEV